LVKKGTRALLLLPGALPQLKDPPACVASLEEEEWGWLLTRPISWSEILSPINSALVPPQVASWEEDVLVSENWKSRSRQLWRMWTTAFAGQLRRKFDLFEDSLCTSAVVLACWRISGLQMMNTRPGCPGDLSKVATSVLIWMREERSVCDFIKLKVLVQITNKVIKLNVLWRRNSFFDLGRLKAYQLYEIPVYFISKLRLKHATWIVLFSY
jgi:hypothetical protein